MADYDALDDEEMITHSIKKVHKTKPLIHYGVGSTALCYILFQNIFSPISDSVFKYNWFNILFYLTSKSYKIVQENENW